MNTAPDPQSRDAGNWAKPIDRLNVTGLPAGAVNLNVAGKALTGPLRGFGQMWQKTYWVRLIGAGASPEDVIRVWKAEFPSFWPQGNRFYAPLTSIAPGEVAVLNLSSPGGMQVPNGITLVSTGVMVIYADDVSFSFMTPQGHPVAGIITFSAHEQDGATVAQAQALIRASDPLFESLFRLGIGHNGEDQFWGGTLRALAARFGASGEPQQRTVLVDPRLQWSEARNLWHNAAIRTALFMPVAIARKVLSRG
jgi:hypothetical protein